MSRNAFASTLKTIAVLCLCAQSFVPKAQSQTSATAPGTPSSAAAALVSKQYIINQEVVVAGTAKPLPKDGGFSVRPAQQGERIADCDASGAVCLEVLYRAGQPEIACGWTVLFAAAGAVPKVVNLNDAAAQYMLRRFGFDDPERPKRTIGQMPLPPPFMKMAHQSGSVVVRAVVDPAGKVVGTGVVESTNPMVSHGAIEAINSWQFETFTLHGRALPYEERISMHVSWDSIRYVSP